MGHPRYTEDFKIDAVKQITERGYSVGDVSQRLGVSTHSLRRTKVAQIYRKTGNFRAVQLLLGHTKLESTVRYLGVEVEDALENSESIEM